MLPSNLLRSFLSLIPIISIVLLGASETDAQQSPDQQSLRLADIFGDNMVIQQKTNATIWGQAKPNAEVMVGPSWMKQVSKTTADEKGHWTTTVETPAAGGGPLGIVIGSEDEKVELKNVLAGEVWICSGQSNMEWKMRAFGVDHFKEDVAKADRPNIRYCHIPKILSLEVQDSIPCRWSVCSPETVLDYSSVAYFFADKLEGELNVPIGLVSTNWGGSTAEAWIDKKWLEQDFPEFNTQYNKYAKVIAKSGATFANKKIPKGINHKSPSVLYNKMIHPLIPLTIKGVIWYQGESNMQRPEQYARLFPTLIKSWRQEWNQGDFPFYFVQIAPYGYTKDPVSAAFLREAQLKTLSVPNTGMAVTMDIGNAENIHPKQKKPVGERLALLALAKDYGKTDLVYSGPIFTSFQIEENQIRLNFDHIGGGLVSRDGQPLSYFTIAGEDKVFVPAKAQIDGDSILVSSDQVAKPIAVRFAWGSADAPNLMNKAGLPASSFRTDDWAPVAKSNPKAKPNKRPQRKNAPPKRTSPQPQKSAM